MLAFASLNNKRETFIRSHVWLCSLAAYVSVQMLEWVRYRQFLQVPAHTPELFRRGGDLFLSLACTSI
jgi:hypothetical protein